MEHESIKLVSKWWSKVLAAFLGLSLPGFALILRSSIEAHLASISPELLAKGLIVLLSVIGLLGAWVVILRPWLTWDIPTGTWVNRFSGIRYCGTCKANKKIISPLKNEITGWRCVACNTFRTDPARKQNDQASARRMISHGIGSEEWRNRG